MRKCLFIIFIVALTLSLNALGTLRVESIKELPATHTNLEVYDADGKYAPVLLVKTELKGLGIQNIGRPTKHAPEYSSGDHHYKFYMNDNQRVVKITHADYEPLEVRLLADFGINVKAQRVYELVLSNRPEEEYIPVNIITDPSDAEKIVDGNSIGTGRSFEISVGKHLLEIRKQGYKLIKREIEVSRANNLFTDLNMRQVEIASVIIKSIPKKAKIKIDDQDYDLTDNGIWLFPGEHYLLLSKTGYFNIEETIEVFEEDNNIFEYKLTKNTGTLQLNIDPVDAKLNINGTNYSNHVFDLEPGIYDVNITKEQYLPFTIQFEIKIGETFKQDIVLTKNVGVLNLTLQPTDAAVSINDKIYTRNRIELTPGSYVIAVSRQQYLPYLEEFNINLGQTINKNLTLTKNVGTLKLNIEPSDARVLINKELYVAKKEIELTPGSYKIEISKEGYHAMSEPFEISIGKVITKSFELKQRVGILQFSVDPLDANIVMKKDEIIFKTWNGMSYLKSVPIGMYDLIVKHSDYVDQQEKITIQENQILKKNIILKPFDETMLLKAHHFEKHKWISLGSAGALLAIGLISNFVADGYYDDYQSANTTPGAISNRDNYEKWDQVRDSSYYISIGPIIYGAYCWISETYYRNRAKKGK
ncbi:MAG: PEGA domain-containing protein [Candidatus Tenebribacter mawsonii]|nr:PEGA domain-containing protein [Candidatus Tenebribacter mawsonii]